MATQDATAWSIDEQAIQHRLDTGQLRTYLLAEGAIVAQSLRRNPRSDFLCLLNQRFELIVAVDTQMPETLKKLVKVLEGAVAKYLGLTVVAAGKAFGEVRHQS